MPNDQSISINNYLKQLYSTFSITYFFNAAYFSKTLKTSSFFSFSTIMKMIYGNLNEKQIIPFQILQFTEIESLL